MTGWLLLLMMLAPSPRLDEGDLPRILVFTRMEGFRHDCVDNGVKALRELAVGQYDIEVTDDPAEFAPGNLSRFDTVVFLNTTGDVLDGPHQDAFEGYMRNGGGFVGVHAAADTEYDWPFYGSLLGGAWFKSHPAVQKATTIVEDPFHPAMSTLPERWERVDEWYEFRANPRGDVNVLASMDESTYSTHESMGDHPIIWTVPVGNGVALYTGGGHTIESFDEPAFRSHLLNSIKWTMDDGWIDLIPSGGFTGWKSVSNWKNVDGASMDSTDRSAVVVGDSDGGILVSQMGDGSHIKSESDFGDVELHLEFMVPEGSNSGVYLQGRYEVQILDSWAKVAPSFGDCGGIYERWDDSRDPKGYEGHPPDVNASRKPGDWQTYDIVFRAPRFDEQGSKIANARFERVLHNGILIHEDLELSGPTRGSLPSPSEVAEGPLMLQGDHGPVAFRNIRIRRIERAD
ncbi:MAG: glycosyl hydrolase [Phycisphaerae bacterium]|nr:glycosyl hydrolase [Phycisphaerae bacterium]|tara:strand:+ start:821 stop:2194 length:1374 start_codon:yes stop_codon:yes gene_type:complete